MKNKPSLTPSIEQQIVCDHIEAGDNVVVDACAGSGKSTIAKLIFIEFLNRKINIGTKWFF